MGPEETPGRGISREPVGRRSEETTRLETHLPGVIFLFRPGIEPDLRRSEIEQIVIHAQTFLKTNSQEKTASSVEKGESAELIKFAKETGLQAIELHDQNRVVRIGPRRTIEWNRELLQQSLGRLYPSVVHETTQFELLIPGEGLRTKSGVILSDEIMGILQKALQEAGLSEEEIGQIVSQEIKLRVDQKELQKYIEQGRATLREGAMTIKETWAVTPDEIERTRTVH